MKEFRSFPFFPSVAIVCFAFIAWKEASVEGVNAIANATRYHSEWFWQGGSARLDRLLRYGLRVSSQDRFTPNSGPLATPLSREKVCHKRP